MTSLIVSQFPLAERGPERSSVRSQHSSRYETFVYLNTREHHRELSTKIPETRLAFSNNPPLEAVQQ
jgi:hypothetical protein